jgi:signal transduction histidine kinase
MSSRFSSTNIKRKWWKNEQVGISLISLVKSSSNRILTVITLLLVVTIGLADFLLQVDISLLIFYFIPITFAVVARGSLFGFIIALACVSAWLAGDWFGGAHYSSLVVPAWNAGIALLTYSVLIILLSGLLSLQDDLEERVRERTAALDEEIKEKERLGTALLQISERERLTIGRDLHDGLSQHLTGTALTGQLLYEKLSERGAEESADALKLVSLLKESIVQTRDMAKGLLLAEINNESLPAALREFCEYTAKQFGVKCTFTFDTEISFKEFGVASHLFRIAQEATRNAIRHGKAKTVAISLKHVAECLVLTIEDDGVGLPPEHLRTDGLGLRIMAHRAHIIGASFQIKALPHHGTHVECLWPLPVIV